MSATRIAVIYYSATGGTYRMAEAYAAGAADAGAEVRLRRAAELAPDAAIDSKPQWRAHLNDTANIPVAELDDLVWANGLAMGTPTRFGNVSSQLKQFLDTTSGLWMAGKLANKAVTGFTASSEPHGGQESTLLAMYHTMFHWGSIIVPPGWVDFDIAHAAGGNPYGISQVETQLDDTGYAKAVTEAARWQGRRLTDAAGALTGLQTA